MHGGENEEAATIPVTIAATASATENGVEAPRLMTQINTTSHRRSSAQPLSDRVSSHIYRYKNFSVPVRKVLVPLDFAYLFTAQYIPFLADCTVVLHTV